MTTSRLVRIVSIVSILVLSALAACDPASSGVVTIGLTSDFRAGTDITRLAINMTVDGALLDERELSLVGGTPDVVFPAEFTFDKVANGAVIDFHVRGFEGDELRVDRRVRTTAMAGRHLLLRLRLESLCMLFSATTSDPQPSAPSCDDSIETCLGGKCASFTADTDTLEEYHSDWADQFDDECKPLGSGEPIVLVGEGQTDYLPMDDDAVAQVEAGPQGGHHIWVATRIKNLHKSGSITSVGGEIPEINLTIPPLKVVFTMDLDEGGFCKLYGLRFQLDIAGDDIQTMLGKRVKVKVEVRDEAGDVGTGERWVILSDTLI